MDDRIGAIIPVGAEIQGELFGVWGGVAMGYLAFHQQKHHGKTAGGRRHWVTTAPGGDPGTYRMDFLTSGGGNNCPVEGCWGRAATQPAMQVHLFHRNVQDTVIILEE